METPQPWYIGQRTEYLALMHLTRHPGLIVDRHPFSGSGLDFLVTIAKNGKITGRQFGVAIKPIKRSGKPRLDRKVIEREETIFKDTTFPICMFAFTPEDDDRSFYRWIKEPRVSQDGAILKMPQSTSLKPLDYDSLETIVESVDSWYDAKAG